MKETFSRNKDTIMLVLLVAGLAGVAFQGGAFLVEVAKWPLMIAFLVGIAFGIGNDGYHSLKRLIRDKVWPWIKAHTIKK